MVGQLEVPEKFMVGGVGGVGGNLDLSVYLSPLRERRKRRKYREMFREKERA